MGENENIAPVGNYGMELIMLINSFGAALYSCSLYYSAKSAPAARRWVFFLCSLMEKIIGGHNYVVKKKRVPERDLRNLPKKR